MALTPRSVFRYYEVDGVPSSGKHKPLKSEIIQLLEQSGGVDFDTLDSLTTASVSPSKKQVYIAERTSGRGGGAWWAWQSSEPDVPSLAKTQDGSGVWWLLQPSEGVITVEMMGARGGFLIDADTRTIFNSLPSDNRTSEHLYLIDQAVRRFRRILGSMADVSWSISSGEVVFVPDVSEIRAEQYDGCLFVKEVYETFATSKKTQGRLITSGDLDAAEAINGATNATAIQAAIDYACKIGANVSFLSPDTYPVAATIRATLPVEISGVPGGRTRLYAVDGMAYNNPVFQTGEVGVQAENVWTRWLIFDANLRRLAGSAGSVTGAPSGTACSFVFQRGGGARDCWAYDGRKHCFDVTGSSYPVSGSAGTVADQIKEMSDGVVIRDCHAEGAGDDEFTMHAAKYSGFEHCTAMFNTGGDTNNSVAFEFDDGCENCWGLHLKAMYSNCGLQIKGHNAGRPARDVFVDDIDIYKCNNGVMIWHTDFGSTYTRSPIARNVTVKNARFRHPLAWIEDETIKVGLRCYAYDRVKVELAVAQEGADPAYFNTEASSQGVVGLYSSVAEIDVSIKIKGFLSTTYGVNITSSAGGPIDIRPQIIDGPLTAVRQANTGAFCVVHPHTIIRTEAGGTTGILGEADIMTVLGGRVVNYTTAVDVD